MPSTVALSVLRAQDRGRPSGRGASGLSERRGRPAPTRARTCALGAGCGLACRPRPPRGSPGRRAGSSWHQAFISVGGGVWGQGTARPCWAVGRDSLEGKQQPSLTAAGLGPGSYSVSSGRAGPGHRQGGPCLPFHAPALPRGCPGFWPGSAGDLVCTPLPCPGASWAPTPGASTGCPGGHVGRDDRGAKGLRSGLL